MMNVAICDFICQIEMLLLLLMFYSMCLLLTHSPVPRIFKTVALFLWNLGPSLGDDLQPFTTLRCGILKILRSDLMGKL